MKNIRILIALALILSVVVIAQGGVGAWANKLQANPKSVAPASGEAGARPQGTVAGDSSVPIGSSDCTLLATFCATSSQVGLIAEAITELPSGITPPVGEKFVPTRIIRISGDADKTSDMLVFTLTPALAEGEMVAYWDGAQWVHLTATDGKYTIEAGAPLPLFVAGCVKE
jgi:hypothetical protein